MNAAPSPRPLASCRLLAASPDAGAAASPSSASRASPLPSAMPSPLSLSLRSAVCHEVSLAGGVPLPCCSPFPLLTHEKKERALTLRCVIEGVIVGVIPRVLQRVLCAPRLWPPTHPSLTRPHHELCPRAPREFPGRATAVTPGHHERYPPVPRLLPLPRSSTRNRTLSRCFAETRGGSRRLAENLRGRDSSRTVRELVACASIR